MYIIYYDRRNDVETNPVKLLQTKSGVNPDGAFGPNTFRAVTKFYKLSKIRSAHFFGQCSHESAGLTKFSENLNYSESGLLKTFGKYFNAATAKKYARNPEMIANRVYANRMGNGDEKSGDGWKYRGRGAIQLTGKNNYTAFAKYLKRPDILKNPDIVATELAFESAKFFFDSNGLWTICDRGVNRSAIIDLTKRINGGIHGLDDRINQTVKFYNWP